jgi:hypothetical protein
MYPSDMPNHGHDYQRAKAMFLKGEPLTEIAQKLNIPYGTLRGYARRRAWKEDTSALDRVVNDHVAKSITNTADGWIKAFQKRTFELMTELKAYDFAAHLKDMEPESYVRTLKMVDDLGRRALGIQDASQSGSQTLVQVVVNGGSGITVKQHPNTLDVTNPE